jgi:hypothetical protein
MLGFLPLTLGIEPSVDAVQVYTLEPIALGEQTSVLPETIAVAPGVVQTAPTLAAVAALAEVIAAVDAIRMKEATRARLCLIIMMMRVIANTPKIGEFD